MCWNVKYVTLLLFSTIITYLSGVGIKWIKQWNVEERKAMLLKKSVLIVILLSNLGLLFNVVYNCEKGQK